MARPICRKVINMFALNTMPIAATGAFPYATRIWFSTMVDRLIRAEKIAVGRPMLQIFTRIPSPHRKYFGLRDRSLDFFRKYHRK